MKTYNRYVTPVVRLYSKCFFVFSVEKPLWLSYYTVNCTLPKWCFFTLLSLFVTVFIQRGGNYFEQNIIEIGTFWLKRKNLLLDFMTGGR